MAKRKKTYKRRKVGAALNPKSPVVMAVAVAAGYFLGDKINAAIDKVLPASLSTGTGIMGYIPTIAEAGIGSFLLMGKGKSSLVKAAAGGVLLGAGLKRGLKKAGIVTGFNSVPVIGGYNSVPVIGRSTPPPQLNGFTTSRMVGGVPPSLGGFTTSRMVGGFSGDDGGLLESDGGLLAN